MSDLCLDEYTDHGHCGVLETPARVDNDATVERYRRIAARAGRSGRTPRRTQRHDGRTGGSDPGRARRRGYRTSGIMAYAAKFASAFYGPFRDAAECAPRFGDRTTYQRSANADEALREIRADLDEGADIVMVKPAVPYLDLVRRAKSETGAPVAAYNCQRRVRDGEGGGGQRMARRTTERARDRSRRSGAPALT